MMDEEQNHSRDDIYSSVTKVKVLAGLILAVLLPFAGGSVWVYRVDATGLRSEADIKSHSARLEYLEKWQIKSDAERFTAKEASELQARLSSLEQQAAEIYRTLQRIDAKLQ